MICDRLAASKTYNRKNYNTNMPIEYFYKEKDKMVMNKKLMDFLEEFLKDYSKNGNKVLNHKYL